MRNLLEQRKFLLEITTELIHSNKKKVTKYIKQTFEEKNIEKLVRSCWSVNGNGVPLQLARRRLGATSRHRRDRAQPHGAGARSPKRKATASAPRASPTKGLKLQLQTAQKRARDNARDLK